MSTDSLTPFKANLKSFAPLMGTFLKTPAQLVCEILGRSPLDMICIDSEHAPFGPAEIDACLIALRAAAKPTLVRVASSDPRLILSALDSGATGIVVPHVTSATQAAAIVKASHYGPGGRGYAGSTRAADYSGKTMAEHLQDSASTTTVIVQIEDVEALDAVEDIARVEGVDGLFVGRMDLTVAMGASSPHDTKVTDAVKRICHQGRKNGCAVGMFTPTVEETAVWMKEGASFFLLASDHAFLMSGAQALMDGFQKARPQP